MVEKDFGKWTARFYDGFCECEAYSPAGEDVVVSLNGETLQELARDMQDYWESFDPEEHAVMWFQAGNEAPHDLRLLLDDAEEIECMMEDLAIALSQEAGTAFATEYRYPHERSAKRFREIMAG